MTADAWPMIERCALHQVEWALTERQNFLNANGCVNRYNSEFDGGEFIPVSQAGQPPVGSYHPW